jgi:hypothetical protein
MARWRGFATPSKSLSQIVGRKLVFANVEKRSPLLIAKSSASYNRLSNTTLADIGPVDLHKKLEALGADRDIPLSAHRATHLTMKKCSIC